MNGKYRWENCLAAQLLLSVKAVAPARTICEAHWGAGRAGAAGSQQQHGGGGHGVAGPVGTSL